MPGPTPKDAMLRQRRNKASTRATLTATEEQRKRAPALPKRAEGQEWHPLTRAWWSAVWKSPMAAEFLGADVHGLYRLAVLVDQFWVSPSKELAAEIRLQQQAYGLSPLDRRRLEWTVGQAEEAATRRQQRKVRQAQDGELDPRQVLKVLSK